MYTRLPLCAGTYSSWCVYLDICMLTQGIHLSNIFFNECLFKGKLSNSNLSRTKLISRQLLQQHTQSNKEREKQLCCFCTLTLNNIAFFCLIFQRVRNGRPKADKYFIDPDFPAENSSVFKHKPITKTITWKRPNVSGIVLTDLQYL